MRVGMGGTRNIPEAKEWLMKAAKAGDQKAIDMLWRLAAGSLCPPYFSSIAQNATIFFSRGIPMASTEELVLFPTPVAPIKLDIQGQVRLWIPAFYVFLALMFAYMGGNFILKNGVRIPFGQPPPPSGPPDPGQLIAGYIDNLPSTGHAKLDVPETMEKGETDFAILYVGGLRLPMKEFLKKHRLAGQEDAVHIKILSTMRATLEAGGFTILNTEPKTAQTVPDSGTVTWTWTIRADIEGRLPVSATLIGSIPPYLCEGYENKGDCPKEHVQGTIPPKTITVTYGFWHKTKDFGSYISLNFIHPNAASIGWTLFVLLLAARTSKKVWDRISPRLRLP